MLKQISNLGKTLNRVELSSVKGGEYRTCPVGYKLDRRTGKCVELGPAPTTGDE